MKNPTSTIAPESLAQLPRPEALDYLKARSDKIHSVMAELSRFKAVASHSDDEQYDQHVIMSKRCQTLLEQAMAVFPAYEDFREWAGVDSFVTKKLVPQALSCTAGLEDRYTAICNWASEGLARQAEKTSPESLPEVAILITVIEEMRRDYSSFLSDRKLFPAFMTDKGYRSIFLFKTVFESSLDAGIERTAMLCATEPGAKMPWDQSLDGYRKRYPEDWAELTEKMRTSMRKFDYSHTKPLREYLGMSFIPDDDECSHRFSRILQGDPDSLYVSADIFPKLLEILQLNHEFWVNEFPEHVERLILERASHAPGETEAVLISKSALPQMLKLISLANVDFSRLVNMGLTCIGGIDADGGVNVISEKPLNERIDLLMDAYQGRAEKLFSPQESRHDMLIYLIVKNASPEQVEAIASTNDIAAAICYELTGRSELLQDIKDKRHVDRAFSTDLGL